LRLLLAPLFVALDALLSAVDSDIRLHLFVVAWGCLATSLGWAKHDCLTGGGMWGGERLMPPFGSSTHRPISNHKIRRFVRESMHAELNRG
jgi:hypothetical protein